MRFMTLVVVSVILSGCLGTRVVEIDRTNESDRHTLAEAAQAQSGEILTDTYAVRFRKNQLQITRDTLRVLSSRGESGNPLIMTLRDNSPDVRFRDKGSPLGAVVGVVAGSTAGYAIGYSRSEGSGICCTRKENAVFGAAVVGAIGAVVGAFVGPKKTTIYRFRADTPRQVSVVIGVGPTAPARASIE